jgi:hypothetical protein
VRGVRTHAQDNGNPGLSPSRRRGNHFNQL